MLDDSEPNTFAEVFMADKRQLGMILVSLIEDKNLEPRVEKEDIGWDLDDLDAFNGNEAGPEKDAFAAFIRFIRERQIGGSKATKLQTFWIEQGGEEHEESLRQNDLSDNAPAAAPVPPEETARAGMPANTPNPLDSRDEEEDVGKEDDADMFGGGDADDSPEDVLGSPRAEDDDLMGEGLGSPAPTPPAAPAGPTPAELGRNIRAAIKKAGLKIIDALQQAGVADANQHFMTQYEAGKRELTETDLDNIAHICKITPGQIRTGEGLEVFFPKKQTGKNALVPVKQTIELPPVSKEQMAEHYMSRVLSGSVRPANGVEVGQLVELAAAALRGEEVDWVTAWSKLTADGQQFQRDIDAMANMLSAKGPILQIVFLQRLAATLFPPEDPS